MPPVIPIVMYNGSRDWDAELNIRDKIEGSNYFASNELICKLRGFNPQAQISKEEVISKVVAIKSISLTEVIDFAEEVAESFNDVLKMLNIE